jgi:Cdc6-like AAA superfamily ATPase
LWHPRCNFFEVNIIIITGSAGTGKSYLLKYIVQEMRRKFEEMAESDDTISARESVVITAPTGNMYHIYVCGLKGCVDSQRAPVQWYTMRISTNHNLLD